MVPLNENNSHWTLSFIDPVLHTILYYDPMHSNGGEVMDSILDFIEKEHEFSKTPFDRSIWTLEAQYNTPRQNDSNSCGILTIQNALCIGLAREFDCGMESVSEIRKKIKVLLTLESLTDPYVYDVN